MIIDEYFINGLLQLAGLFLAITAGVLAVSLLHISHKKKKLWPWKILIAALITFGIHKIFSALHAFNVLRTPYLGQVLPFFILGITFWAVAYQIQMVNTK